MSIQSNTPEATLLVVDDEPSIRELLSASLRFAGFNVLTAADGHEALHHQSGSQVDLVVLDIMLPDMDGFEVLRRLRERSPELPVLFLTARDDIKDKVQGLTVGGDDYITKPFSPKELVARIKAVMRRISPMAVEEVIEMQGLSLDPTSHRVMTGENPLDMGPTEFKLLHFFMTHPERVYSREQLLNNVWGTNVYVEDRTVDVHIRRLRKALELSGHDRMVQTVRGTGYRFSTRF